MTGRVLTMAALLAAACAVGAVAGIAWQSSEALQASQETDQDQNQLRRVVDAAIEAGLERDRADRRERLEQTRQRVCAEDVVVVDLWRAVYPDRPVPPALTDIIARNGCS